MTEPSHLDEETLQRIEAELAAGRKISAIKIHREATGLGLAESKAAVEAMSSGADPRVRAPSATAPRLQEVEDHLRNGRKIEAIKAYRELTGSGLKAAKEAVETMSRSGVPGASDSRPTVPTTSGCLTTGGILLAASLALHWL